MNSPYDFPIMFPLHEFLPENEETLLRHISIIVRCVSFRISFVSAAVHIPHVSSVSEILILKIDHNNLPAIFELKDEREFNRKRGEGKPLANETQELESQFRVQELMNFTILECWGMSATFVTWF